MTKIKAIIAVPFYILSFVFLFLGRLFEAIAEKLE